MDGVVVKGVDVMGLLWAAARMDEVYLSCECSDSLHHHGQYQSP